MAEYIEREAALSAQNKSMNLAECRKRLERIPAADVREVVYARPVKFYNDPWTGRKFTTCSACDGKIGPHDKFCKHCGAKMDGDEDNER